MKAYYDRNKQQLEFAAKNVKGMLKELDILENTVIIVVNKEVVTKDYTFKKEDKIKILSVVSGG
jgi:thiamine biosynthesis protein ThiS